MIGLIRVRGSNPKQLDVRVMRGELNMDIRK